MRQGALRLSLVALLAGVLPPPAQAVPAKLDARARAAVAALRAARGPAEALRARGLCVGRDGTLDVFVRGTVSRDELEAAGARVRTALPDLFTASIPVEALDRVAALAGVRAIRGGAPCAPELDASLPTTGAQLLRGPGPGFAGAAGQGVLIGIIDSGVDYGHGDFQRPDGSTRLVKIWDQTASGTGLPGYPYGKECSPAEIDLGTCLERDSLEHGTHIAGIAAGDGSQTGGAVPAFTFAGMAPLADLVVVKTDFITPEIIDGISYVFGNATARGQNAVVNLSLGTQYGSHDGNSDFEQAVAALVGPGRIVVKSAGNDRGQPIHAQVFATAPGASATVSVSGSALYRYFQIDGYYAATDRLRVWLRTPNGTTIGPLSVNTENAPWPGQTTGNGTVYVAHDSLTLGRKNVYIEVQVEQASRSMNGTWTITFLADQLGPANGEVDLWRYLVDPNLTASFVTGNLPTRELVSEPGNAAGVITVGAWVTKQAWTGCNGVAGSFSGIPAVGNLAPFSSPGPTRDGRLKPDLTAPGTAIGSTTTFDISRACPAPPTVSQLLDDDMNHQVFSGTSLSAPHVTGAVALLLQRFGALTPAEARDHLQARAVADAFTGAVPSADWGHGKLHLDDIAAPLASVGFPNGGETFAVDDVVELTWTATDLGGSVAGVDLQLSRTGPDGPFEDLAIGVPNTGSHSWVVTRPNTGSGQCYLRVRAHDDHGNVGQDLSDAGFTITEPVGVAAGAGPAVAFSLSPVRPNPTAGAAHADFDVPRETRIRLAVHDVQGRVVAVLADGVYPAGRHHAAWEGPQDDAPAGLYFLSYDSPVGRMVKRFAVTR